MSERGHAPGWCIRFRSIGLFDTCEAGVPYAAFRGVPFDQKPCFLDKETGQSRPGALPCDHLKIPTAEEIKAHEIWVASKTKSWFASRAKNKEALARAAGIHEGEGK